MKDRGQRPTITGRQLLLGLGVMALLAGVMAVGLTPRTTALPEENPPAAQVDAAETKLAEGCQVVQRMIYTPCGHETTRRQPLPQELIGKTRAEAEAAYDDWQITGFSANELSMEQTFDFYCAHQKLLKTDASGML